VDDTTGDVWIYIPETIEEYQEFQADMNNIYNEVNEIKRDDLDHNPNNPFQMMKEISLVEETLIGIMMLFVINDLLYMDWSYCQIGDGRLCLQEFERKQEVRKNKLIKKAAEKKEPLRLDEQKFMSTFVPIGIKNALCYIVGCQPEALLDSKLLFPEWIRDFAQ
jgi:hypothetical protein